MSNGKKVLCVIGPTATGKTALAARLATQFSGTLISADSRQVYKGMDVGTGKDVPEGFAGKIYGYDLVEPGEEFSSAHFVAFAKSVINRVTVPIIVGGTGLYIKQLLTPPATIHIPPNEPLRSKLEKLNIKELQHKLKKLNIKRFNQMNHSDSLNPRRLIRAIEVEMSESQEKNTTTSEYDSLIVGLTAPRAIIDSRIEARVRDRMDHGMEEECRRLLIKKIPPTLGYEQIATYLNGECTKEEAVSKWITAEKQYARRQLTWFKKQPNISWFDITKEGWEKQVVGLVAKWYSELND